MRNDSTCCADCWVFMDLAPRQRTRDCERSSSKRSFQTFSTVDMLRAAVGRILPTAVQSSIGFAQRLRLWQRVRDWHPALGSVMVGAPLHRSPQELRAAGTFLLRRYPSASPTSGSAVEARRIALSVRSRQSASRGQKASRTRRQFRDGQSDECSCRQGWPALSFHDRFLSEGPGNRRDSRARA